MAGRLTQSGMTGLNADYLKALNGTDSQGQVLDGNGTELTQTLYSQGSISSQRSYTSTSTSVATATPKYTLWYGGNNTSPDYDAEGHNLQYLQVIGGDSILYTHKYQAGEGFNEIEFAGTRVRANGSSKTTSKYDANGFLVAVDAEGTANDRTIVNDAHGKALYVNQGGHVQRQLIANGEVLGRYGEVVDDHVARTSDGTPTFKTTADFGFVFASTAGNTPDTPARTHVVQAGDTMQALAQSYYGDSKLWYRIAEANGLSSNDDLTAGQILKILGTEVTGNDSGTFKPYDPSKVIGDTTPIVPPPKKSHDWFGQFLVLVVAVVAAAYLGPQMLELVGAASATTATATELAAAGALTGAASNAISQVVGIATGVQDGFNWKGVAQAALSGGITGGIGRVDFGLGQTGNYIARAATANALTQGASVVLGLQSHFSWNAVAASAVGAGVGQAVGGALGLNDPSFASRTWGEQFGTRFVTGLAAGAATAVARGGRVAVQQVAADAFGQTIGSSLAEAATGGGYADRTLAVRQPSVDADTGEHIVWGNPYQPDPEDARQFASASTLNPTDNSDEDVLLAAGDRFSMGRGPMSMNQVGRKMYITEEGTAPVIDSMLAQARSEVKDLQRMRDEALTAELNRNSVIRETVTPLFEPIAIEIPSALGAVVGGVGDMGTSAVAGLADITVAPLADLAQMGVKAFHGAVTGDYQALTPMSSIGDAAVNRSSDAWDGIGATALNVFNVSPLGMVYSAAASSYGMTTAALNGDLRTATSQGLGLGLGLAGASVAPVARAAPTTNLVVQAEASALNRIAQNNRAGTPWADLRRAYQQAKGQVDFAHIEADVTFRAKGKVRAQGGHFFSSPMIEIVEGTESVGANGVVRAQIKLLGPDGNWYRKSNSAGGISSLTPSNWSLARAKGEMSLAWLNRALDSRGRWEGNSSGVTFRFNPPNDAIPTWRGYPLQTP